MASNKYSNGNPNTGAQNGAQKRGRGPMGGGPMGGGPMAVMGAGGVKAKDFRGTMKKLIAYLGRYKIAVISVIAFSVLSTVFAILGPQDPGQRDHQYIRGHHGRHHGLGRRDRLRIHREYHLHAGNPVRHKRGILLPAGLHHDQRVHENYL